MSSIQCSATDERKAEPATLKDGKITIQTGPETTARMIMSVDDYLVPDNGNIPANKIYSDTGFTICDGGYVRFEGRSDWWGCGDPNEPFLLRLREPEEPTSTCRRYRSRVLKCKA